MTDTQTDRQTDRQNRKKTERKENKNDERKTRGRNKRRWTGKGTGMSRTIYKKKRIQINKRSNKPRSLSRAKIDTVWTE